MPKINKYRKKTELPELAGVEDPHMQHLILKTIEATERFVLCASIAMGITQMMALTPSIAKTVRKHRYLRTSSEHMVFQAVNSFMISFVPIRIFRDHVSGETGYWTNLTSLLAASIAKAPI